MSELTRELIDLVLRVPTIRKEYYCHEEVHFYDEPDRLEIEKNVDEWFEKHHLTTLVEKVVDNH